MTVARPLQVAPRREPAGVPVGGQFAATAHAEPAVQLTVTDEELSDLTYDVQDEYDQASDWAAGCTAEADQASVIGSREEKDMSLIYEQDATDTLTVAARRLKAVHLAANPEAARPDWSEYANPRTVTEVRKAVRDAKAGKVHGILLRREATGRLDGRLEIAGPKDGTPLFVDISSGFSPIRVTSGTVVVNARSTMGNGIDVGPDATVVVIADPGRKVSTTVEGGIAVVVGADEAHGLQFKRGGHMDVVAAGQMRVSEARPA